MSQIVLPEPFSDLQPFVKEWALPARAQRFNKRWNSDMEQIGAFYNAMLPRLDDIVAYLNTFKLSEIPENSLPLMHMSQTLIEISRCIEVWDAPDNGAFAPERVKITL